MRHRTSLLTGLSLLLMATTLPAQEPPPPPPPTPQQQDAPQFQDQPPVVQHRLQVLFRGITLTPEQRTQVDSVLERHSAEVRRLAADYEGNGDGNGMSDDLKSALEKQEKEIRDGLTPDQQQTWDRNAEQLKAMHKGMQDEQKKDSLR